MDESVKDLDEEFNLEPGAKVAMKIDGKTVYGKVVGKEKVMGKPGVEVKWDSGQKGRFMMSSFASLSMDRKADYIISAADYLSSVKHYMEYENLTGHPSAQESVEEKFYDDLRQQIRDNFSGNLTEKEKLIVIENKDTQYAYILRKILPEPILRGLTIDEYINEYE